MPVDDVEDGPAFFDTNILLYLFDLASEHKRQISAKLIEEHQLSGRLRLSVQVVHEFAANLLSKKFGLEHGRVLEVVRHFVAFDVTVPHKEDCLLALALMKQVHVSLWDAMILVAAKRAGCRVLYSEDFQHGRVYDTVKVINPFIL